MYGKYLPVVMFLAALSFAAVARAADPDPNEPVLWLKGDAGVETDETGKVTVWKDQSGNENDAAVSLTIRWSASP